MSDKNATALNTPDDDFIIVRCKMCNKILTEVSAVATGKIRQKCLKCKSVNKISLPLRVNSNSIFTGQNVRNI